MPGPKGFIHGWIYVGGPGLPAPGSPDAPDAPRWAPGQQPSPDVKPAGAGWVQSKLPGPRRGDRVSVQGTDGTHRTGTIKYNNNQTGGNAVTVDLDPIAPGAPAEQRIVNLKRVTPVSEAAAPGSGQRQPTKLEKARGDFPPGAKVRMGRATGVVEKVDTTVNTGQPHVRWWETNPQGQRRSGPYVHAPDQLERIDTPAAAGLPTKRVQELPAVNRSLQRVTARKGAKNKDDAARIADTLVDSHDGDAQKALDTFRADTDNATKGRAWQLKHNALLERWHSQQTQWDRENPLHGPPRAAPGVGTPEDFTTRNTGSPRLGIGSTTQTPQGPGRIVGAGGSGASEKYSVELADGRTVVIGANQARPVEPRKGQRAEWIGSGIRGKVVAVDSDSVTIEHQELGNTVRKKFRKNEVSVVTPKRKRAS